MEFLLEVWCASSLSIEIDAIAKKSNDSASADAERNRLSSHYAKGERRNDKHVNVRDSYEKNMDSKIENDKSCSSETDDDDDEDDEDDGEPFAAGYVPLEQEENDRRDVRRKSV